MPLFTFAMNVKLKTLSVYLVDLNGSVEWPAPIRRRVEANFKRVVDANSKFSGVSVQWTSRVPKLADSDLICYFVDSHSDSVAREVGSGALGESGTTRGGHKETVSEVYLRGHQDNPKGLGNVAFHELMHNVLQIGNDLHQKPGMSMGREEATEHTPLSSQDISLINWKLVNARKQYTAPIARIGDPFGGGL